MSESRKNHLTIDGGQVKDDDPVASYKPIPESDQELRKSKSSLSKSKEKVSGDGAEEKLLQKEDEAKITTRVDMADAKYVVGDHRNGDAKIELDANKRQFTGLTKEELMKYADDPFWVRLRWFMFIMFWLLWLCMLAGAIVIIVRAPKCPPPPPKTWFQKGPLADFAPDSAAEILAKQEALFPDLQRAKVGGIFVMEEDAYKVLDDEEAALDNIKRLVAKAKEFSIRVIVDLVANYVPIEHKWFELSVNRSAGFADYFIWADGKGFESGTNEPIPPNNWKSSLDTSAWALNEQRNQFYYHQHGEDKPQLNFNNADVVRQFETVLDKYIKVGVAGVRLVYARELLVNASLADEVQRSGKGVDLSADHTQRSYWYSRHTSDLPGLVPLLEKFSQRVNQDDGDKVFTLKEEGGRTELFLLKDLDGTLRPPLAAPVPVSPTAAQLSTYFADRLPHWPAVELQDESSNLEASAFVMLLPAAPVLPSDLFEAKAENESRNALELFGHLVSLRSDTSVEHGNASVVLARTHTNDSDVIVCARWKMQHTGYAAVWNPTPAEKYVDLSTVASIPSQVTLHYASQAVRTYTNYTNNLALKSDQVLVPSKSTVVLSYVPKMTAEK